ncbi:stalk domain-containing protein [Desulfotomaculum copahuensis]|uniref:PKD/Chitinase domain-containing protein n=1 Tax=Desulfotomaculum copahuensis TaxID=1838280 RepID=A0A1B7LGR0_9FIRM|nr:stalk domain-containing protein [Desulfotomaculum copahuensis]OAT85291.1 hypothetical protein A6M21_07055 [Desulfotomaculum copahuensis]
MKRTPVILSLILMLLLATCLPGPAMAAADTPFNLHTVVLTTNEKSALVDNQPVTLPAAPRVEQGVTLVPLRFLAQTVGMDVYWNQEAKTVTLSVYDQEIDLTLNSTAAMVNHQPYQLDQAPRIIDGVMMVPLRFIVSAFGAGVDYQPQTHEITLTIVPPAPPPPNQPPVARFSVNKTTVAQGETVIYTDQSYDPDGDKLIAEQWTGKKRAFFKPGQYTVSLQVEDSRGNWSQQAQVTITVTNTVLMDEVTYNLQNPIPGEPLDISRLKASQLPELSPQRQDGTRTLLMSNSPEKITTDGILYMDTVAGPVRLFYHHTNDSTVDRQVYVVAANPNSYPVNITMERQATAGPGDPMSMGRAGTSRFLQQNSVMPQPPIQLPPGQSINLCQADVPPGQTVHGIFDLNADAPVTYYFITVSAGTTGPLFDLPLLPPDPLHTRGTFQQCDRRLALTVPGGKNSRLILADGKSDPYISGKNAADNTTVTDKGNYGVLYELDLTSGTRVGILANARGGPFAGAMRFNGQTFNVPSTDGVLANPDRGAMVGVLMPNQPARLWFMPPSGSHLPLNLLFIPF